ncbi:autotransporter outer membrane beta-barrel domain-containing protein [Escherichia coli]|nr:autotransporter outer membrane beta-barrel domain-containing protein [Escherichia coli]
MNRIYRVIWNCTLQVFQACSELTRRAGKIEANWINNSKVYAVKMNGQTVGREGARNLGEVRTGVEAKVNNNLSLWGNVGVQLGDKGYSDTQGMLGVKYSW